MTPGALQRIAELERELGALRASAAHESIAALPETLDVLVVRAGEATLALPLADVHEVLPRVMLFRLPSAPAWHAGSLAWKGRHVPVVDLAASWAGTPLPVRLEDRIVLLGRGGHLRGVLVAEVLGVYTLARVALTPSTNPAAAALATRGGETLALIAADRLPGYDAA